MSRQQQDLAHQASARHWRFSGIRRAIPLLAVTFLAAIALSGCGVAQHYTTISPETTKAKEIQDVYTFVFIAALIVFVGVQGAITYAVLRFRQRSDDRPKQIHGSRQLEILWTAIPTAIMLIVFIRSSGLIFAHGDAERQAEAAADTMVIEIYGKQWWWEVHYVSYPGSDPANPLITPENPVITANEVRIPQGANVLFKLRSNNVIHSFSVPRLSGKVDVVPGHDNKLQFVANADPGEYWGECAEFCGASHAWMRFKVLVVPPAEFDAWVGAWRTPPAYDANPETADVHEAPAAFAACLACHRITGTNAKFAQTGLSAFSDPKVLGPGPDLTLLGCRADLAAGLLVNNEENIKTWLMHTDQVKEGVYMPNYYEQGTINDADVAELAKYLSGLKPIDGACPSDNLRVSNQSSGEQG